MLCDILGGVTLPPFLMEIKVYTTPGCFYCTQIKELFKRAELEYQEELIDSANKSNFRKEYPNAIGFPFTIIDDEHYTSLVEVAQLLVKKGLVSAKK